MLGRDVIRGATARLAGRAEPLRGAPRVAALALILSATGCGDGAGAGDDAGSITEGESDTSGGTTPQPSVEIEVVEDAPTPAGTTPDAAAIVGDPLALVATSGTEIFVATETGPMRVVETSLVPVEIVTDGDTPSSLGTIVQSQTIDGTALFLGSEGLFANSGDRLVYHPLSDFISTLENPTLFGGSRSTDGTLAYWVFSDTGDYRITDGTIAQWTIPQFTDSARLSAAAESDGVAMLAEGDHVVELTLETGAVRDLEQPAGAFTLGVRDETARVYLAGDHGILVRDLDGVFRHYTLGADAGAPAATVSGLLTRPGGGVYALVDRSVLVLDDAEGSLEELLVFETPPDTIATDGYGHLWVVEGGALSAHYAGEPVSFAEAVAPVLGVCDTCHLNDASGAVIINWTSYDEAVLRAQALGERTKNGTMPPPGTGLELAPAEIATIDRWISTGTLP